MASTRSISLLGLGAMGDAIADAFLQHGYELHVWNRTIGKTDRAVSQGAIREVHAKDCVEASPIVIICITRNETVLDLVESLGQSLRGKCVLNFSNGTPGKVRSVLRAATDDCGIAAYLHGAIMAAPPLVRTKEATVLYGGPSAVFEEFKAIFETLGTALWISEDQPRVAVMDCSLLTMLNGVMSGFLSGLAMAGASGVPEIEYANEFVVPLLSVFSEWLPRVAKQVQERQYAAEKDGSSIISMLDSTRNIFETADELGVSMRLQKDMLDAFQETVEAGNGEEDISGLVRLLVKKDKKA